MGKLKAIQGSVMNATTSAEKRQELRRLLKGATISIAPGAADVLTAQLIAQLDYRAVYLSGSLQHAMRGYADINALTMSEMVQTAHNVAGEITIPCLADAETGFGIEVNVRRTVREFERTGVAGIHIEDSTVPKRPARLGFEIPDCFDSGISGQDQNGARCADRPGPRGRRSFRTARQR